MSRISWLIGGVCVLVGSIGAGCVLVTGSTDGYQQADSGAVSFDAACTADAGCLELTCLGASECGDGGVCCLSFSGDTIISSCQSGSCQLVQLCTGSAECGGNKTCTPNMCTSGSVGVSLQGCGAIPGCSH